MKTKPEELLDLARLAEIFSFRLFAMNRKRSDTGKNDLFRQCHFFHNNYQETKTIQIAKYYLAWYIDHHGDIDRFQVEMKELFDSSKKQGYYSWNGLVYFLYDYETYKANNEDMKVDYEFANQKTKSVEHILPQNYKSHWKDIVKGVKKADLKRYIHSLGNLVLINSNKNSSLRDTDFTNKKSKYITGSFSEIEISTNNRKWTLDKILKREKELLKYVEVRWQLNSAFLDKFPFPEELEEEITDEFIEEELD